MCKHVAAVLYGVGARLDKKPEQLFVLRKVDHEELISAELDMQTATTGQGKRRRLANQDLSNMFGIDIEDTAPPPKKRKTPPGKPRAVQTTEHISQREYDMRGRGKSRAGNAKATSKKQTFTPTSTAVSRLRKQFGMTRSQFADLLGVTPTDCRKLGNQTWQTQTSEAHADSAYPGMVTEMNSNKGIAWHREGYANDSMVKC